MSDEFDEAIRRFRRECLGPMVAHMTDAELEEWAKPFDALVELSVAIQHPPSWWMERMDRERARLLTVLQLRAEGRMTPTVHVLWLGRALCGQVHGEPSMWGGARWVHPSEREKATCVACRDAAEQITKRASPMGLAAVEVTDAICEMKLLDERTREEVLDPKKLEAARRISRGLHALAGQDRKRFEARLEQRAKQWLFESGVKLTFGPDDGGEYRSGDWELLGPALPDYEALGYPETTSAELVEGEPGLLDCLVAARWHLGVLIDDERERLFGKNEDPTDND